MTYDFTRILERIERALADFDRVSVSRLLLPGMTEWVIVQELTLRDLTPLTDLKQIYQWHNGTDATTGAALDDLHLFPGYYFLRLEDALANYDSFLQSNRWHKQWLPVFANGGGDFYAVTCATGAEPIGSVVHFRIDQSVHPVEYHSLGAMLQTVAAAYEEHIYFIDDNGYLEMDDHAFIALASRLNSDVPWWRDDV